MLAAGSLTLMIFSFCKSGLDCVKPRYLQLFEFVDGVLRHFFDLFHVVALDATDEFVV